MNSDCEAYANQNAYQSYVYAYLLSRIIPSIKECDNVLDVGCGDGKSTDLLYQTLITTNHDNEFKGSVLGIDLLPPMVEYSRERYCSNLKSLIFAKIDIASENASENILSTIKEGYIDHVVSSSCFHWIEDQPKALANLLKVINPGVSSINLILYYGIVDSANYATVRALNNQEFSPHLKKLKEFHEGLLLPWRRAWMIEADPIKAYKKMMIDVGYNEDGITIEKLNETKYSFLPSPEVAVNCIQASFPDVLAEIEKMGLKEKFFRQFINNMLDYNARYRGNKLTMSFPLMYVRYHS
ncbi:unnamed protein product [Gordionus sp. m RMFG-2023]